MGRLGRMLAAALIAQRGALFPWVPVVLACGIGLYFSLRWEPAPALLAVAGVAGIVLLALQTRADAVAGPVLTGVALVALGFALAGFRAHWVAGPVLETRYYGPVEGRLIGIDRSASDALRLTLDRVRLDRPGQPVPQRVRISLHGPDLHTALVPGKILALTAHLGPPGGAVEPGGFDFRRHAWFLGLGAVGYSRSPVMSPVPQEPGLSVGLVRLTLAHRIRTAMPGDRGAFAAAILTGDRSGLTQPVVEALRATNLAHLLAISGLHMGLLSGFVFAVLRLGLLLLPVVGLRWPVKRLAAAGALVAAAGYLALSGGNVATERAFVMVAVALGAVMLDRRAFSLRSVALAAVLILTLQPEALLSPGFQMSFAATTALVAVFGVLQGYERARLPRWLRPVGATVLSSLVAGLATAPVGLAHFNLAAQYGLLANLIAVPVMGIVVMPAAVLTALLAPLGVAEPGLWLMGAGLDWILGVAQVMSDWPSARRPVVQPSGVVLPLIALGALWVMLWQGRLRLIGVLPVCIAVALWFGTQRPDILISGDGALVGVMTSDGRWLSRASGAGFVAEVWLENDGDRASQESAARRPPDDLVTRVVHLRGRRAQQGFQGCDPYQIVVSDQDMPDALPCMYWDSARLRQSGAVAITVSRGQFGIWTEAEATGQRLWRTGTNSPPDDQ